ncbi:MAG: ELWxxDGT repeat protein [Cyanobium sp.]|nr:ELWxxDGT repeat protein [Cyanobium sp.]
MTTIGNTLYFTTTGVSSDSYLGIGEELFKSDGTLTGTVPVADIRPGSNSSSPRNFTPVGDTLYFTADDGTTGRELWKSNGTAGTTVRVADIRLGAQSSEPRYLTPVGSTLYFTAFDDTFGTELWKTDGTTAGTMRVADISPGSSSSAPRELTAVGNTLYFTADDGSSGRELWKTDGTSGGTVRVADIRSGFFGSNPANLTAVGTTLYFTADNGSNGRELWAFDSVAPTQLSITASDAVKSEGLSGLTAFRFAVSRSGDLSARSSVRWAVTSATPSGSLAAANAADFGGVLPSGIVRFRAGQRTAEITVNVRGDRIQERDERFFVTLSDPTRALISSGRATGTIRNDDRIGTAEADTLIGNNLSEYLDGRAGADILISGSGMDVFGFRFGESRVANPDRITDFAFGADRIQVFESDGSVSPTPLSFSRAAQNRSATTLRELASSVFADADGALAGSQALGAQAAALVVATDADIRGTYLLINDGDAALSLSRDLLINISGYSGVLPGLGSIAPTSVFV